jgi:hypothetical protein
MICGYRPPSRYRGVKPNNTSSSLGLIRKTRGRVFTLSTGQNDVLVEVLLGHKRKWQELVTFPLEGEHIESGAYLAYSNTALRPLS